MRWWSRKMIIHVKSFPYKPFHWEKFDLEKAWKSIFYHYYFFQIKKKMYTLKIKPFLLTLYTTSYSKGINFILKRLNRYLIFCFFFFFFCLFVFSCWDSLRGIKLSSVFKDLIWHWWPLIGRFILQKRTDRDKKGELFVRKLGGESKKKVSIFWRAAASQLVSQPIWPEW